MLPKGLGGQRHPLLRSYAMICLKRILSIEASYSDWGPFTTFHHVLRAPRSACGLSLYPTENIKYMFTYKMLSEQNNKVAWEGSPM